MAGKGGKTAGAGRKPAPEPLKAITFKIPESRLQWLRENVKNKSEFVSTAIANAMAEQENEKLESLK